MTVLLFNLDSVFTELDQKVSLKKPECQYCNQMNYLSFSPIFRRLTPKLKPKAEYFTLHSAFRCIHGVCTFRSFLLVEKFLTIALLLISHRNQYQWQYEGKKKDKKEKPVHCSYFTP